MKKITALLMLCLMIASVQATVLSVTESQYVRFEPDFLSPAWQVVTRGDNSAEYILVVRPQDVTGDVEGTPVQAERGFQLRTEITKESCDYSLTGSSKFNPIYKYRVELEKDNAQIWQTEDAQISCHGKNVEFIWMERDPFFVLWPRFDVYCLYKDQETIIGEVSEGKINFDALIELRKDDGTTVIETISTLAGSDRGLPTSTELTVDDEQVGVIRWIGGVLYGEFCPGQDRLLAAQDVTNTWYTVNKQRYIEYNDQYLTTDALVDNYFDLLDSDEDELLSSRQIETLHDSVELNNRRADAAQVDDVLSLAGRNARNDGASINLELARDHLIYAPDFQILLRADFLNIVYLIGRPRIVAANFVSCIEGGTDNTVQVTVKNEGEAVGKFVTGITCEDGIFITATERSITLTPGESGTVTFPFSIDIAKDSKRSCVINIADATNPANKDDTTISTDCSASVFCSPDGLKVCRGETEVLCENGQWNPTETDNCKIVQVCNRNSLCEPDMGESFESCGGKGSAQNDCATCNSNGFCQSTETMFSCPQDCDIKPPSKTSVWVYALMGVAAAFVIFMTIQMRKKKSKRGGRRR